MIEGVLLTVHFFPVSVLRSIKLDKELKRLCSVLHQISLVCFILFEPLLRRFFHLNRRVKCAIADIKLFEAVELTF